MKKFKVKYCNNCLKAWESNIGSDSRTLKTVRYHRDMPSYGLIRENCKKCLEEINGNSRNEEKELGESNSNV